jgi:hypothetical protein
MSDIKISSTQYTSNIEYGELHIDRIPNTIFRNNQWYKSADGQERLFFTSNGDTYIKPTSRLVIRDSSGFDSLVIDESKVIVSELYVDNVNYFKALTGQYGSVQVNGTGNTGYQGYSIGGRAVFMHDGDAQTGIFNDHNNQWLFRATHNKEASMYYNGGSKLDTRSDGIKVSGSILVDNNCRLNETSLNFNAVSGKYNSSAIGYSTGIYFGAAGFHDTNNYGHIRLNRRNSSAYDVKLEIACYEVEIKASNNMTKADGWYFTGVHRSISLNKDVYTKDYTGLIVISCGDYISPSCQLNEDRITMDNAEPIVDICIKQKDKRVFGVIAKIEAKNASKRKVDYYAVKSKLGDRRIEVNSLGEGGIWVCNANGAFENGDYITSSDIPGYGMKQDNEFLCNHTVGKITTDCSFSNEKLPKREILTKKEMCVDYDIEINKREWNGKYIKVNNYDEIEKKYFEEEVKDYSNIVITHNVYDKETGEIIIDPETNKPKVIVEEVKEYESNVEEVFQRDENGVFIISVNSNEYIDKFKTRYLTSSGDIINHDEYQIKLNNNEEVYMACFVGCTYHCG